LWQTLGWGFAAFIVASTKYTAIYASFAIVIFSMIWLYLNWLIVLIGASIACYHQYPALLVTPGASSSSAPRQEKIALLIATFIGRNYYQRSGLVARGACRSARCAGDVVETVFTALQRAGYITDTADDPPLYIPARSFETISVKELLDTLRAAEEEPARVPRSCRTKPRWRGLLARVDEAVDASLSGSSLRDLAMAGVPR